jgi:hypothetical protein
MGIPTDLTTKNYKDIIDEEFQHLFNFNFGILESEWYLTK